MTITRSSAVEVSTSEFKLWVLERPQYWDADTRSFNHAQLLDLWQEKYGLLTSTEKLRFLGIVQSLAPLVQNIVQHCQREDRPESGAHTVVAAHTSAIPTRRRREARG